MLPKSDQVALQKIYEMNLGPAAMGVQPVGKPVIVTMDMPGAEPSMEKEEECEDTSDIEMANSSLHLIERVLPELQRIVKESHNIEGWVSAKITKAADYISGVYNYLEYENSKEHDCGCGNEEIITFTKKPSNMFNMGYENDSL